MQHDELRRRMLRLTSKRNRQWNNEELEDLARLILAQTNSQSSSNSSPDRPRLDQPSTEQPYQSGVQDGHPEKRAARFITLIQHPLLCLAVGMLVAGFAMTYPVSTAVFCGLLIFFAVAHSGFVSERPRHIQAPFYLFVALLISGIMYSYLLMATPWKLQHSASLSISASVTSPEYVPGTHFAGFEWKPDYKGIRVYITNDSNAFSVEQLDLVFRMESGIRIMGAGQDGGIATCRFNPLSGGDDLKVGDSIEFEVDPNGQKLQRGGSATSMRLRPVPPTEAAYCDHIPPTEH